jgi:hypothetical protein
MITHIALFRFRPEFSDDVIEQAMNEVMALKEQIEVIIDLRCGKNFSQYGEGYTHAIVVTFKDESALNEYRFHPAHKPIADKLDTMEERSIGVDFQS